MAMLLVIKLDADEDMVEFYDRSKVKYMEKPAVLHELSLRMKMKKGEKWVIVPSPKKHSVEGKFEMSLYFDCKLMSIDVRRLNGPREQYKFIAEEYEKNVNKLPCWKEDLCRVSIPYIIGQPKNQEGIRRRNTLGSTMKRGGSPSPTRSSGKKAANMVRRKTTKR